MVMNDNTRILDLQKKSAIARESLRAYCRKNRIVKEDDVADMEVKIAMKAHVKSQSNDEPLPSVKSQVQLKYLPPKPAPIVPNDLKDPEVLAHEKSLEIKAEMRAIMERMEDKMILRSLEATTYESTGDLPEIEDTKSDDEDILHMYRQEYIVDVSSDSEEENTISLNSKVDVLKDIILSKAILIEEETQIEHIQECLLLESEEKERLPLEIKSPPPVIIRDNDDNEDDEQVEEYYDEEGEDDNSLLFLDDGFELPNQNVKVDNFTN